MPMCLEGNLTHFILFERYDHWHLQCVYWRAASLVSAAD